LKHSSRCSVEIDGVIPLNSCWILNEQNHSSSTSWLTPNFGVTATLTGTSLVSSRVETQHNFISAAAVAVLHVSVCLTGRPKSHNLVRYTNQKQGIVYRRTALEPTPLPQRPELTQCGTALSFMAGLGHKLQKAPDRVQ
jgi:hypothetical protein